MKAINEFKKSHQLYCSILYFIVLHCIVFDFICAGIYKRALHLVHVKMTVFHCYFCFCCCDVIL